MPPAKESSESLVSLSTKNQTLITGSQPKCCETEKRSLLLTFTPCFNFLDIDYPSLLHSFTTYTSKMNDSCCIKYTHVRAHQHRDTHKEVIHFQGVWNSSFFWLRLFFSHVT